MATTSFLAKPLQNVANMGVAIIATLVAVFTLYYFLEAKVVSTARAEVANHEIKVKPVLDSLAKDSKFTRCVLIMHVKGKDPKDIVDCEEHTK